MAVAPTPESVVRMPRAQNCPEGCGSVHSYTADGTRWCWLHAKKGLHAIDAENCVTPPQHLRQRFSGTDQEFWKAWTALEVEAKITDSPVLTLLGRGRLGAPDRYDIWLRHVEIETAVVCIGGKI